MKLFIFSLSFLFSIILFSKDFNIIEYGAISGDIKVCTKSIQDAIDDASNRGGGRVIIPIGRFITGTIFLKSNVTLYLEEGAILEGSTNLIDYPEIYPKFKSYTDSHSSRSIIYAEEANNISIEGKGLIDGNGGHPTFTTEIKDNDASRPYGIRIISCSNIIVRDIRLQNSAQWMQHYLNCDYLKIDNIQVLNHVNRNNDGLDIDGCRNVVVSNCIIDSDDDALCLKADGPSDCNNITITNCILKSNCNAFKMGTETTGGFKNIAVSNLTINAPSVLSPIWNRKMNLAGIVILSMDGGKTENITINNVVMDSVYAPFFIKLGNRARKYSEDAPVPEPGSIKNIRISNVIAHDTRIETSHISGFPGHYIENLTLENIEIHCYGGGKKSYIENEVKENEAGYPDVHHYAKWYPSYGLYLRHVKGFHLNNVRFILIRPDERPAIMADDVVDFELFNVNAELTEKMRYLFYLKSVKNASFRSCSIDSDEHIYSDDNSKNIIVK